MGIEVEKVGLERRDAIEAHNALHPPSLDGPKSYPFTARFEAPSAVMRPGGSKLILSHLPCAQPAYVVKGDYLKTTAGTNSATGNYLPTPNSQETRFHRGFYRRPQSEIRQDFSRLQREAKIQQKRDEYDEKVQEGWRAYQRDYTFNVLTGEGNGREGEFTNIGRRTHRITAAGGTAALFAEHDKDTRIRERNSHLRYSGYPPSFPTKNQAAAQASDGFLQTQRESVIIGYPRIDAAKRIRLPSQGARDTLGSHLHDDPVLPDYPPNVGKTRSQIIFG
ncbi:unnamed protein product [Amoebophrya sp. A25]|nr:unnamed protein product [Amoebophrya sp. A25]|eukprot:GSA25T00020211001.1